MEKYIPLLVASYLKRTHTSIFFLFQDYFSSKNPHIILSCDSGNFKIFLSPLPAFHFSNTLWHQCCVLWQWSMIPVHSWSCHGTPDLSHIATGMRKSSSKPRRKGKHKKQMAFLIWFQTWRKIIVKPSSWWNLLCLCWKTQYSFPCPNCGNYNWSLFFSRWPHEF